MSNRCVHAAVALVLAGTAAACSGDEAGVTVAAASSLAPAVDDLVAQWEADGGRAAVELVLGGSNQLARQVVEGAPIDVLAAADETSVERVVAAGEAAGPPVRYARNQAVLVTGPGADADADAGDAGDAVLATCAPEVPCGAVAAELLGVDDLESVADTLEPNVRAVATKVRTGEVDRGVVYRTDVVADPDLRVIGEPEARQATTDYVAVAVADDPVAMEFVAFLASAPARRILRDHGFVTP